MSESVDKLQEAEVVFWLKQALRDKDLKGRLVKDILVDADPSYLRSKFRRHLEPTGTIWISDRRPDLVCNLVDNSTELLVAFEVKAHSDHEKGIVQASRYRYGVHESYLCIPTNSGKTPKWLRDAAAKNGVGLIRVSNNDYELEIEPEYPLPDPKILLITQRYLLGEKSARSLCMNRPLHYAAALIAFTYEESPKEALINQWGIKGSSIKHSISGAETLGLLMADGQATIKGRAYAEILKLLGFDFSHSRYLTKSRRRLAKDAPGFAAVLRSILLDHPVVDLIIHVLADAGGTPISADKLAEKASLIDEGMARAAFGMPPILGETWQIKSFTRFNLKAAMYDVGLLDSPLSEQTNYDPKNDLWQLRTICGIPDLSS
ncbi:MAG: hypothetical protein IGS50_18295 [Synechococcales cyanobacterium C42_A2020_086]|jgi:hypothetical protein|nr:hypothetical protein [Synechococcales cyanobacterium C42_A2020_086]